MSSIRITSTVCTTHLGHVSIYSSATRSIDHQSSGVNLTFAKSYNWCVFVIIELYTLVRATVDTARRYFLILPRFNVKGVYANPIYLSSFLFVSFSLSLRPSSDLTNKTVLERRNWINRTMIRIAWRFRNGTTQTHGSVIDRQLWS